MSWNPVTEQPAQWPCVALLAAIDPDDGAGYLCDGRWIFDGSGWCEELTGRPGLPENARFWIDEEQLFQVVPLPRGVPA